MERGYRLIPEPGSLHQNVQLGHETASGCPVILRSKWRTTHSYQIWLQPCPPLTGILVSDSFQTPSLGSDKEAEASAVLRKQTRVCSSDHVVGIPCSSPRPVGSIGSRPLGRAGLFLINQAWPQQSQKKDEKNPNFVNNLIFKEKKKEVEKEMEREESINTLRCLGEKKSQLYIVHL